MWSSAEIYCDHPRSEQSRALHGSDGNNLCKLYLLGSAHDELAAGMLAADQTLWLKSHRVRELVDAERKVFGERI